MSGAMAISTSVRAASSMTVGSSSISTITSSRRTIANVKRGGGAGTMRRAINVPRQGGRAISMRSRDGHPQKEARGAVDCSAAVVAAASTQQGLKVGLLAHAHAQSDGNVLSHSIRNSRLHPPLWTENRLILAPVLPSRC